MGIITRADHVQWAEVEFAKRHPDIFLAYLMGNTVYKFSKGFDEQDKLNKFRCDINAQTRVLSQDPLYVDITIGGQAVVIPEVNLHSIAYKSAMSLLKEASFLENSFEEKNFRIGLDILPQSPNLNGTTNENKYADTGSYYGHHLSDKVGINGTFPSLVIAQQIDSCLDSILEDNPDLRPDGKVMVTVKYNPDGFKVDNVYYSIAHGAGINPEDFRNIITDIIHAKIKDYASSDVVIEVNGGGEFNVYSFLADTGVSKCKDDVTITGGINTIGTDKVWGKCLYKVSSAMLPYVFALSKVICEVTGASYASVGACAHYGKKDCHGFVLQEIDPVFENHAGDVNAALSKIPSDRDAIRDILKMPITLDSYALFNDVGGFHSLDKPWKNNTTDTLKNIFQKHYQA